MPPEPRVEPLETATPKVLGPEVESSGAAEVLARDLDLLRRWREGDTRSGEVLLASYKSLFYRVARRFGVVCEDEVLDLYQDVVVDLLERLDTLPERVAKSFAGFLAWRVRHAVRRLRARRPAGELAEDTVASEGSERGIEAWDAIENCWERLPPREHRVFELRYLQGLSLKEVARALGSNVNAVGQSLFRLCRRMRECLKASGW